MSLARAHMLGSWGKLKEQNKDWKCYLSHKSEAAFWGYLEGQLEAHLQVTFCCSTTGGRCKHLGSCPNGSWDCGPLQSLGNTATVTIPLGKVYHLATALRNPGSVSPATVKSTS